jgi:hypothetical protein
MSPRNHYAVFAQKNTSHGDFEIMRDIINLSGSHVQRIEGKTMYSLMAPGLARQLLDHPDVMEIRKL